MTLIGMMKQAIDLNDLNDKLRDVPLEKKKEILALLERLEEAKQLKSCQTTFLPFVRSQWASFIHGRHHEIMAEAFEKVARGELKRLIINMPPRHTKSEFASYLFQLGFLVGIQKKKSYKLHTRQNYLLVLVVKLET